MNVPPLHAEREPETLPQDRKRADARARLERIQAGHAEDVRNRWVAGIAVVMFALSWALVNSDWRIMAWAAGWVSYSVFASTLGYRLDCWWYGRKASR